MDEAFGNMFKGAASKFISANKAEADKIKAMSDKRAALEAAEPLITKFRGEQLKKGQNQMLLEQTYQT
jgi:ureidoglycolate hydrolase